jgi:hypothetical protein
MYDPMVVDAAKSWRHQAAPRFGMPVSYKKAVAVRVQ